MAALRSTQHNNMLKDLLMYRQDDELEFIPEDPTEELVFTVTGEVKKFTSNETLLTLLNFICPKCNINCGTQAMWKEHMVTRHNFPRSPFRIGNITCKFCPFRYSDTQSLDTMYHHFPKHMTNKHYVLCTICGLVFTSPMDGEYHIFSYHRIANKKTFFLRICYKCNNLIK